MKRATLALSALAIAATVGTAMAHTKAVSQPYCAAAIPNTNQLLPYDGLTPSATTCTLTVFFREEPQPGATFYAIPKTTPAGDPCPEIESCPTVNLLQQ
ncbi:hypothetical protein [Filimonas effusa]|uniref:Uncharacterized protein n=1 Tax=Filimonas effusa TaxID=2508721 RepID=A0A4Q1D1Q5_9BACT|nr:hypothetical protein [Filimonas effusa]RXK81751.1 hypothetical protein ESB13_18330 [Filimonas effusa]